MLWWWWCCNCQSRVYFNVDATALEKQSWMLKEPPFHAIVFNFPHLGGATEEDVAKNQTLLRFFFFSTRRFLHPTQGQVLVALRNTLFYNRWKIQEQAVASGFRLKKCGIFIRSCGYDRASNWQDCGAQDGALQRQHLPWIRGAAHSPGVVPRRAADDHWRALLHLCRRQGTAASRSASRRQLQRSGVCTFRDKKGWTHH